MIKMFFRWYWKNWEPVDTVLALFIVLSLSALVAITVLERLLR